MPGDEPFFGIDRNSYIICNPANREKGMLLAVARGAFLHLDDNCPATVTRRPPWWAFWRKGAEEPVFYFSPSRLS